MNIEHLWTTIDRFGIIVGLIAAIPVFYAAWSIWDYKRKHAISLENIRRAPGNRPAILIVDILKPNNTTIQPQVENWIRQDENFKDFPKETIHLVKFEGEMSADDLDAMAAQIRKAVAEITAKGTDKIHLFMRCPMPLAAIVGEILSNGCPTLIYHYQPNIGYQNWGPLYRS